MNRTSFTTAQLKRAIRALEDCGKTVSAVVFQPDGSWELRTVSAGPDVPVDTGLSDTDWQKRVETWRRSGQSPGGYTRAAV